MIDSFSFYLTRVLSGNKVLSLDLTTNTLELTDFVYDGNTNIISGKIKGEVKEYNNSNKYSVDLDFNTKVWEEIE